MLTRWREHQNRLFYYKKSQTLELPHLDLKIPRDDILEFCVFSGNYTLSPYKFAIISELSVIFRHENQTIRAPVILQGKGRAKSYAQKLAELTQVKFNMYYQTHKKDELSKVEHTIDN